MKIVKVSWIDSRGSRDRWVELEEIKKETICQCESIGFLVHEDNEKVVVMPHYGHDPKQGCGDMTIPKVSIIEIIELTKG